MEELERFKNHAEWETTPRYSAHVWKGDRLMRMVSYYPESRTLYDTMPGRYGDKEDQELESFARIIRQYKGREGWAVKDESQYVRN